MKPCDGWFNWLGYLVVALMDQGIPIGIVVTMMIAGYQVPFWAIAVLFGLYVASVRKVRREVRK